MIVVLCHGRSGLYTKTEKNYKSVANGGYLLSVLRQKLHR